MIHMPQVGALYRRKGGGFIALRAGIGEQVTARIMADAYDVGYLTGWMPVASFWALVDAAP
jgi:hypothetical protein